MSSILRSFDPATGAVVWEGPEANPQAVGQAVERARCAFHKWAATPIERRIEYLRAYKSVLEARAVALAELISRETGKPLWESRGEVTAMIGKVEVSIAAQAERAGERYAG